MSDPLVKSSSLKMWASSVIFFPTGKSPVFIEHIREPLAVFTHVPPIPVKFATTVLFDSGTISPRLQQESAYALLGWVLGFLLSNIELDMLVLLASGFICGVGVIKEDFSILGGIFDVLIILHLNDSDKTSLSKA